MRYLVHHVYKLHVYQEFDADSPEQAQELGDRLHRALVADGFDGLAQAPATDVQGVFDHQGGPDPELVGEDDDEQTSAPWREGCLPTP